VIYFIPHKVQTKNTLDITFTSQEKLKNAPDGPLYIANNIYDKPTNGILIDPIYGENVIIEEFLFVHDLYQENGSKHIMVSIAI
jgi:hypothetical protein